MLGVNRTIIDGVTVAFEFLRIEETPKGIVYYASPGGRYPPTAFGLLRLDESALENEIFHCLRISDPFLIALIVSIIALIGA